MVARVSVPQGCGNLPQRSVTMDHRGGPPPGRRRREVGEKSDAGAGLALASGLPAVISLRSFAKYDARVPERTVTSASMPRRGLGRDAAAWAITIALDCEDLFGPARRIAVGRATEIDVG